MSLKIVIVLLSCLLLTTCSFCVYLLFLIRKNSRRNKKEHAHVETEIKSKETDGLEQQSNPEVFSYDFQRALEIALERYNLHPWVFTIETDKLDILNSAGTPFANTCSFTEFLQQAVHPDEARLYIDKLGDYLSDQHLNRTTLFEVFPTMVDENGVFDKLDVVCLPIERDKDGKVLRMAGVSQLQRVAPERTQKLEKIKEMLELSLKASSIVPWELDLNTKLIYAPQALPLSPDCTMSLQDYIKMRIEERYQKVFLQAYNRILEGEQEEIDIRLKALVSETNTMEWVHITGKLVELDGGVKKITGAFQVITKEVNREKELIALRKAAEESNRLKTAFLANMSHEIRTPLNAIVGFSQLLAITSDAEEIAEYNKIIAMNNELLLRLINDILDIAKIESEQMDFIFSEVNLKKVFQQIYQMYQTKMPKGVVLIKETDDTLQTLTTEKNRMIQVISNFLNNAIKFTSTGSITLGYTDLGDSVRIYVRDTGRGIHANDLDKVFERFVKLDSFVQGTGLGLAISQVITERLRGQIGVESEEGKGSEFWIVLPKIIDE